MPDGHTSWFLDQTSLLEELKKSGGQRGRAPVIAGYDDLREISRGGQGVVYAATQRSTRRKVAIKVLLDGAFSSSAARRRFEREIDLVAGLKHPNIVQVYDSGTTAPPDERLYFVMEFIDGQPLTDYARSREPREKLALFAEICDAVNYAHMRGVIHRDLKPSNIRVDSGGGGSGGGGGGGSGGRPHVLDFGLAKSAGSALRDGVTMSVSGQFLGSLPWASPEQAEGALDRIDTRSDVYALGVILFQLLTDGFPYEVHAGFREVLNNILTSEPSRPSSVGRASDDEVDTIVLKCLAKDPARRYQTAGDLSRDVRHYLAGEPIEAKRDSMWYTMRKRLQRYRLAVAAAGLLLLALLGGFGATAWQAHRAEQQRERADEERYRAERRFNDVRKLAHAFIFDFNERIRDLAGSRPAREALVTTALQYLQNLSAEAGDDDPGLQSELAAAWQQVGDIQGDPYQSNLGDTAGALVSYRRAHTIRLALAEAEPDDLDRQRNLAGIYNRIGDIRQHMGERSAALADYAKAIAAIERVLPAHLDDAGLMREMGACAIKMGDTLSWLQDPTRATQEYQRALQLMKVLHERDPDSSLDALNLAAANNKVGYMAADAGDHATALAYLEASLALMSDLAKREPTNATVQRSLEISHNQVGAMLIALQRSPEAMQHFDAALITAQALANADPNDALAASDLAYTHNKIADLQFRNGESARALEHYRTALDIREGLCQKDPNNASFLRDLAVSRSMVGTAHQALGNDVARPMPDRIADLRHALAWFEACALALADMKSRNLLGERDANLPDEVAGEVARARASLAAIERPASQPQS